VNVPRDALFLVHGPDRCLDGGSSHRISLGSQHERHPDDAVLRERRDALPGGNLESEVPDVCDDAHDGECPVLLIFMR
jgi:hypothetical protein